MAAFYRDDGVRPLRAAISPVSACLICTITPLQSPNALCRNSRAVGYHGESARSRSQRQHRPAQCAGQMHHRGVHGDHEIQIHDQRGGVREVGERLAVTDYGRHPRQGDRVRRSQFLLQADELDIQIQQRLQGGQGQIARVIDRWPMAAGPYQADPRPCRRAQPPAPAGSKRRIRTQVWNVCGNRCHGGAKGQRQTHDGTVEIMCRQRLRAGRDLRHAVERLHEPHQRGRQLQHDPRAAPGEQRCVADELHGVAQALLVMHQDGLAGQ